MVLHCFFRKRRASKTLDIFRDALIKPVMQGKDIPKILHVPPSRFRRQVFPVKTGLFGFASACAGMRFFALLIDTRPPATLLLSVSLFSVCQRTEEDLPL
jgi:hypothetical protein